MVLAILAATLATARSHLLTTLPARAVEQAATMLAADLRAARSEAMALGQERDIWFTPAGWGDRQAGHIHGLPTGTRLESMRQAAVIRFFADGSSSGDELVIRHDDHAWHIRVDWLTGRVDLPGAD